MKLNATSSWQSVTTTKEEVWMAWDAAVLVDTDATEAERIGLLLNPGQTVQFAAGVTIYYVSASPLAARIARVAVSA